MKVVDVQLQKGNLLTVPDRERTLFLALGHAGNEINAIAKMLYWAANAPARNDAEDHGRLTMLLLLTRLLAGKLSESWELLRTKFFGVALSRDYEPKLDDRAATALKRLKTYFGKENASKQIRNHFAFHYSPDEVAAVLSDVDEELHLYMEREAAPNNLFAFSEVLLSKALLELLQQGEKIMSLDDLVDELVEVAAWLAQLADSLMFAIIDAHGEELSSGEAQEVRFEDLPDFQSVTLPWFTDTSNATRSQNGLT